MTTFLYIYWGLTAGLVNYLTWRTFFNKLMDLQSWMDRQWETPLSLTLATTVVFGAMWLILGLAVGRVMVELTRSGLEVALR